MSRREQIFAEMQDRVHRDTDRMFAWLLLAQWGFAIAISVVTGAAYLPIQAVVAVGAVINMVPIALIRRRPGSRAARHAVAIAQILWSAMFIAITGGRIATHFHVLGSLAFLAFYRDRSVLLTATLVVCVDHVVGGLCWPMSIYGLDHAAWWQSLEHVVWVVFVDIVLIVGGARTLRELRVTAGHAARIERTNAHVEETVRDQTRKLRETSDRYRTLVENIDAISFEYDPSRRELRYLAPQAGRLLECDPAAFHAPGFFDSIIHPDDRARVAAAIDAFVRGEREAGDPLDHRLIARSGRIVSARTFLSGDAPRDHRICGIVLDVTRHRELEDHLRSAQRLESVGRLAAGVAHEINTPIQFVTDSVVFVRDAIVDLVRVTAKYRATNDCVLASVPALELATAASDTAVEVDLPYLIENLPKALERALDGTGRVAAIVRSMRSFAYEDRGEMAAVDLVDALTNTLIIARNEYRLVADIDMRCESLPPVMGYLGELNQVFLNVVVNAAHAIADVVADTGVRGTITISGQVDGEHVVISIADTGAGIPDEIRERVFDPFFTTKAVGRGTGQGLAIALSVIAKHGGTVTIDSSPGRGATFHVRLPITQPFAVLEAAA